MNKDFQDAFFIVRREPHESGKPSYFSSDGDDTNTFWSTNRGYAAMFATFDLAKEVLDELEMTGIAKVIHETWEV